MSLWRVTSPLPNRYTFETEGGFGHALVAQVVGRVFELVRVSASLCDGKFWWSLHAEPSLTDFEYRHGVEFERYPYNEWHFAEAQRRQRVVRGELQGYSDLFVPVTARGSVVATVVVGPFAVARPTAKDILQRWRRLSGREGHLGDPMFASYLSRSLSILVLEREQLAAFEQLLSCFAQLLAGEGRADEIANRADALRLELEPVRFVERTYHLVNELIDERKSLDFTSGGLVFTLRQLGLDRPVDHVLVGFATSRAEKLDPVEVAVRRDAFQRAVTELARRTGDALSGKVGDRGVVLLSAAGRGVARQKQKVLALAESATRLARERFGLAMHWGVCAAIPSVPLSRPYRAALSAAEAALNQKNRISWAEAASAQASDPLRKLRDELTQLPEENPAVLAARFERYLDTVATRAGDRVDAALAHLEIGFELAGKHLVASGVLDAKTFAALSEELGLEAGSAASVLELSAVYRRAIERLLDVVQRPVSRQGGSLQRALDHIREHYTKPLSFQRVARLAGYAPAYFSDLFKQREGVPFEKFVLALRLQHAKRLLTSTPIPVTKVAEMSGFVSPAYFSRAFTREVGRSPRAYRLRPFDAKSARKSSK
ncbi:MAG TPA: AraC family transcriptional regulator [Polyangiaceae bacterium]|nr:AraC family transcriptional regulator [Polyangiaceae bacterium]